MNTEKFESIFTADTLTGLFGPERTNEFFEALFGDAAEGAYDIRLSFAGYDPENKVLRFHLDLHERPGCCLACNLTYGLPEVFSRHPIINIKGLVEEIEKKLAGEARCESWKLGSTVQQSKSLHSIPLEIKLQTA
ncbi:pancreas/duodenum homeobox protein 1 [Desulfolithobacter sp.]